MSFLAVGALAIGAGLGIAKSISGAKQKRKAKEAHEKAKKNMQADKEKYMNLDTSNPYLNMENTMEDLTVNTQAADFAAEESRVAMADTMANMNAAAGGSGIAALAQAMANQGQIAAQKASVSIADQEAMNQKLEKAETSKLQNLEREGEIQSRNLKKDLAATALGISSAEAQQEAANVKAANEQMWGGISDIAGTAGSVLGGIGGGGK